MVVLVTGAAGQLGQAIKSISAEHFETHFYFASSSEADITDKPRLKTLFSEINPNYCINAAAYTAVDKAESEPEKAFAINVAGVKNLTEICNDFNTVLIHVSTDFVFDGNKNTPYIEEDITNPQGVYGTTKRQGEEIIIASAKKHFIVRTSWLYSQFGNNFMKTMLRLASERASLSVVKDQIGTPTHAVDLAKAILKITQSGKTDYGIYHFSNEGMASWYNFAAEIFKINDVGITLNPIPTADFPTPAKRPKYSVLDMTKIKKVFGIEIRKWEDALGDNITHT